MTRFIVCPSPMRQLSRAGRGERIAADLVTCKTLCVDRFYCKSPNCRCVHLLQKSVNLAKLVGGNKSLTVAAESRNVREESQSDMSYLQRRRSRSEFVTSSPDGARRWKFVRRRERGITWQREPLCCRIAARSASASEECVAGGKPKHLWF